LKKERDALRHSLDKSGEQTRRSVLFFIVLALAVAIIILPTDLQVRLFRPSLGRRRVTKDEQLCALIRP
jgi:hypothetical protein